MGGSFFFYAHSGEGERERGGIIGGREGVGVRVYCVYLFRGYIGEKWVVAFRQDQTVQ